MTSRWTGSTQIVDKHGRVEPEAQETDGLEHGMQIWGWEVSFQMWDHEIETLKERHVLQARRRVTLVA